MIGTDAHGCTFLFAGFYQGQETFPDPLEFLIIGLVGIVMGFKLLPIGIIPGIDAYFFYNSCCHNRRVRGKMNIRYQGSGDALVPKFIFNDSQIFRFPDTGSGEANNLASRCDHAHRLGHNSHRIHGIGSGHRLDPDGITTADPDIANLYFPGFPAAVFGKAIAVFLHPREWKKAGSGIGSHWTWLMKNYPDPGKTCNWFLHQLDPR